MARGDQQRGGGGDGQRRGRSNNNTPEERAEGDIVEKLVHINRVAATVKGGRRFSFAALMARVGSVSATARRVKCPRPSARPPKKQKRL
jgi:hypothetical protein